ncbi:MAG TPA: peptidylprolyl isomerase [Verrucomicrobiae bacterium]|nr:peptidylprolyl isomerase [Verrucomicrobiae bacterium]
MKWIRPIIIAGFFAASSVGSKAELVNAIRAIVDDSVITEHQVDVLNEQTASSIMRRYGNEPQTAEQMFSKASSENLNIMVERELILHEFKTAGYNLPESVIDDLVQERIRARYHDRATLAKSLEEEGMTMDQFRQRVKEQFVIEQLRLKNISPEKIIVSPHKVEAYYLAHRNEFKVEDQVKLRMIILDKSPDTNAPSAEKMAEEILAQIKRGATFREMAAVYTQGQHRSTGGERPWEDKSGLRKELADAISSLKPGECSGIVNTPEACYLVLLEDTRAAHFKSLGEVRNEIENTLLNQETDRLEKQWIGHLKKKTFVQYF